LAQGLDLRPNRTPVRCHNSKLRCLVCDEPGIEFSRFADWPSVGYVGIVVTCDCGFAYRVVREMSDEDYMSDEEYYRIFSYNLAILGKGRGGKVRRQRKMSGFVVVGVKKYYRAERKCGTVQLVGCPTNANKREQAFSTVIRYLTKGFLANKRSGFLGGNKMPNGFELSGRGSSPHKQVLALGSQLSPAFAAASPVRSSELLGARHSKPS